MKSQKNSGMFGQISEFCGGIGEKLRLDLVTVLSCRAVEVEVGRELSSGSTGRGIWAFFDNGAKSCWICKTYFYFFFLVLRRALLILLVLYLGVTAGIEPAT
jgi:hypothetical protein